MIQKITKKFTVLAFAVAMIVSATGKAQIYWDFGTASALSAYPASGIPANITVDSITKGNSTGTPFLSTTSVSSGYVGASGAGNAGVTAKAGPLDYTVNATTGSAFYEITLTPAAGYAVNVTGISFGSRSTGTGPKRYTIRTDLNGYATSVADDTISSATSSWGARVQTVAIMGTVGTALKIRIYGYAGAGAVSAINFRIDDLNILANAVAAGASITMDPQDLTECTGMPATFTVTAANATSYQWQEDAGSGFVSLTNAGIYSGVDNDTLMISDNTGMNGYMYRCIALNIAGNDTSASAALHVNATVTPSVTISGPVTTICEGDSIVGTATGTNVGANPVYTWYVAGIGPVGSDSVLVIPAGVIPAGTYTISCELTSDAMCASPATVMSNSVIVTVNPLPATPVISQSGTELSTSSYDSYQWYYGGGIALGTDSTQTASADGIYTVVVTNAEGCSATSADYNYTATGIATHAAADNISVYPNPSANGIFNYSVDAAKAVVSVYNIIGKQISVKEVSKGTHKLDLSAQANGSYFMSIKTDNGVITKKIIVSK